MLKLREPRVRVWRASVVSVDTRLKKGKVRNYTQAEAAGATLREQRCRSTRRLKLRQQLARAQKLRLRELRVPGGRVSCRWTRV